MYILSIVTCGIYGLYWFVVLTNDANNASNDHTTDGGLALVLTIITCGIYGIYWAYKMGEKLDRANANRGLPQKNNGIMYLILQVLGVGIIAYALMQDELNKLSDINN